MIGITDPDFPNFAEVNEPADADDLTKCKDTTTDTMGTSCPESKDRGWYIKLNHHKKVTAEPTVFKGKTYFPIYKPVTSGCALGDAYICGVDDECGTNNSSLLGTLSPGEQCLKVGTGVLSKIVTFADKLFANIAGESKEKTNLVQLLSINTKVETYRKSWREKY
jgi:type IV pilus assembly protein PilY1